MNNQQVSTATNLQGPDISASASTDNPNKYFNNLYSVNMSTGPGNDAILAFVESYVPNKQAAKNLAASILYTAMAQEINPMKVLEDFMKVPKGQLNSYIAAFLNINRVPTSSLGIRRGTTTSPFVARSVLI
jgi:hypothetical protein